MAGVVRIDERKPGVWYGSRLGVAKDFRRIRHFSPGVAVRNLQPCYHGLGALGAGLIDKAVSTANALGCHEFLATVQHQDARFFQRLQWEALEEIQLHGITHVKIRAGVPYCQAAERVARPTRSCVDFLMLLARCDLSWRQNDGPLPARPVHLQPPRGGGEGGDS